MILSTVMRRIQLIIRLKSTSSLSKKKFLNKTPVKTIDFEDIEHVIEQPPRSNKAVFKKQRWSLNPENNLRKQDYDALKNSDTKSQTSLQKSVIHQKFDYTPNTARTVEETKSRKKVKPQDIEILSQLGEGSFGKVYLCKSVVDGSLYALKVINREKLKSSALRKYTLSEK